MEWYPEHSAIFYLAPAAAVVASLGLAWRFAVGRTARSGFLLVLRATTLAALFVILLEPVRVTVHRAPDRPPRALFLVDGSRSMALERPVSRLDEARRVLATAERQLSAERRPVIEYYAFGDQVAPLMGLGLWKATANETRLAEALLHVGALPADFRPNGVFLASDGRSTETTGLDPIARGFRQLGVPIHVVPVGNRNGAGDVAIQNVIAPREVRTGTKVPVRVVVRSLGYEGERAELRVRSLTRPGALPLASARLALFDGEIVRDLELDSETATGPLVVEVPPLRNEAVAENNRVPFQVARRDPKIRVLYMEGTANEYHWVRDALAEDPNIECVALEVDNQYSVAQRLRRVDDPGRGYPTTREELFGFDVVICSDISRGAFTKEQRDWTVELVNERGGGFAMVGGHTSFGAGRWDQTNWDGMIPVDMTGAPSGVAGTLNDVPLKVNIPPEAEKHPIWHFVDDPVKNRKILDAMPLFFGTNLTDRLKPAATVLGISATAASGFEPAPPGMPQGRANRAGASSNAPGIPVFSCQPYGKGRTFAFSSDTTIAWGRDFESKWGKNDNRYFRKFWRNVVTWLAANSVNSNRRLDVETDKVLYRPGEPIQISARAFTEKLELTHQYRLVARFAGLAEAGADSGFTRDSATMRLGSSRGLYQAELKMPPASRWPAPRANEPATVRKLVVRVSSFDGKRIVAQTDLDVQVIDDSPEFHDVRPDRAGLEALARNSGGRVLTGSQDVAEILASYTASAAQPTVTRTPLWDRPPVLLALIVLLTVEWFARRWKGLA